MNKNGRPRTSPEIRFMTKVKMDNGCWLWQGVIDQFGYGIFWGAHQKQMRAHRFSHEFFKYPIPKNLQIDHVCKVKHCVNPYHLEAVTPKENVRRAPNSKRTQTICKRGHDLTDPANVRVDQHRRGKVIYLMRTCRKCDCVRTMKYQNKKKANQ